MTRCLRFHVSGHVQGVFFRAATRQQAQRLGVTGHALNLPDGRVEVLACGSEQALERLQSWLWQGPSEARVSDVQAREIDQEPPPGFTTG
ncbi:MAG: acylphosphatase [Candidatus Competibacterales bacterium]|nr:acylphosphatase [Candidatus Competibacterales bacterium]